MINIVSPFLSAAAKFLIKIYYLKCEPWIILCLATEYYTMQILEYIGAYMIILMKLHGVYSSSLCICWFTTFGKYIFIQTTKLGGMGVYFLVCVCVCVWIHTGLTYIDTFAKQETFMQNDFESSHFNFSFKLLCIWIPVELMFVVKHACDDAKGFCVVIF